MEPQRTQRTQKSQRNHRIRSFLCSPRSLRLDPLQKSKINNQQSSFVNQLPKGHAITPISGHKHPTESRETPRFPSVHLSGIFMRCQSNNKPPTPRSCRRSAGTSFFSNRQRASSNDSSRSEPFPPMPGKALGNSNKEPRSATK